MHASNEGHQMMTRPSLHSLPAVALAALLAAGLTACGTTEGTAPTSTSTELEPGASAVEVVPTPAPDVTPPPLNEKAREAERKLDQAREAKKVEKADPNGRTVCLKSDGTLAGQIFHARPEGAPPIEESDKERICRENYKDAKWTGYETSTSGIKVDLLGRWGPQ